MWSPNKDQAAEMLTVQLKDIEAELFGEEPLQTWEESDSGDVEADTEVERAQNLLEAFWERKEIFVDHRVVTPERAEEIERSGAEMLMEYSNGGEVVG